jgi:hypothetical protein
MSLVVVAVITLTVIRSRSVEAQQGQAAREPISTKAALQETEGNGLNPAPTTETKIETDLDLYLDADESSVERGKSRVRAQPPQVRSPFRSNM